MIRNSLRSDQLRSLALPLIAALFATTCARATPIGLSDARLAYARVSAGPGAQLVPVDLQKARVALDSAEQNFAAGKDDRTTADLAWVAERWVQIAQEHAEAAMAKKKAADAERRRSAKPGQIANTTQGAIVEPHEPLRRSLP